MREGRIGSWTWAARRLDTLMMLSNHLASGGLSPPLSGRDTCGNSYSTLGDPLFSSALPLFISIRPIALPAGRRMVCDVQSFEHRSTASRTECKRDGRMQVSVVRARFVRPRLTGRFPCHVRASSHLPRHPFLVCSVFWTMSGWSWIESPPIALPRSSS